MRDPIRPNFIVIGPGKCGTTWMYECLRAHPEVGLSTSKETLFFQDYFHKGFRWYAMQFKNCDPARHKAIGEVSNTYISSPIAAVRMREFDPNLKLISSLRNPIDRAFSHYLFLLRNGAKGSFEELCTAQPHILERGLYSRHLSAYLDHFDHDRLLVLIFDDLQSNPIGFANRVFRFLEVREMTPEELADRERLSASKPRNRLLAATVKGLAKAVRAAGQPSFVTAIKRSPLTRILYTPYKNGEKPDIDPAFREQLIAYYHDDVERTTSLIGIDLMAYWPEFQTSSKAPNTTISIPEDRREPSHRSAATIDQHGEP